MEARMPKMLSANQIEAHVTRLQAVREGLRKYEGDDGRAKEAGEIIEVAINTLNDALLGKRGEVEVMALVTREGDEPVTEDSLPTSVLKDEAVEAAIVGEEEIEPINHSDPSNLPPPTPIRPLEDKPALEVEEADPSEATDQTPRW